MQTVICESSAAAGRYTAALATARLNDALARKDRIRLLLATGRSQVEQLEELVRRAVDWERVQAFHLDEYVGLDPGHPASFRRYLKERVADLVPLTIHYVDPNSTEVMRNVAALFNDAPIDVALVGVGENGHIAFNDPPADFVTEEPYIEVELDERCRSQQVGEGWFPSLDEVPTMAVTMSVRAIMRSKAIIATVPFAAKAEAVKRLLAAVGPVPELPASVLLEHQDTTLVLDRGSSRLLDLETWRRCVVL